MIDPAAASRAGLTDTDFPRVCSFERALKAPQLDGSAQREGNMPPFKPTAEQKASFLSPDKRILFCNPFRLSHAYHG
jgi:hypothetical protein